MVGGHKAFEHPACSGQETWSQQLGHEAVHQGIFLLGCQVFLQAELVLKAKLLEFVQMHLLAKAAAALLVWWQCHDEVFL